MDSKILSDMQVNAFNFCDVLVDKDFNFSTQYANNL